MRLVLLTNNLVSKLHILKLKTRSRIDILRLINIPSLPDTRLLLSLSLREGRDYFGGVTYT